MLSCLFAKQIDVNTAQKVASSFLNGTTTLRSAGSSLNLVHTERETSFLRNGKVADNYYYVFNIGNNSGFIIVSADDVNVPVIGYSLEGNYDSGELSDNFNSWMEAVKSGTKTAIERGTISTSSNNQEWNRLLSGQPPVSLKAAASSVAPLIKTKWNQRDPYNRAIPFKVNKNGYSETVATGCMATTMAQIMKYYNFPGSGVQATENYSTITHKFSVPSIDLTKVVYNWNNMTDICYPFATDASIIAVSQLMYHCGASLRMNYDYISTAFSSEARKSLVEYFNYHPSMTYYRRAFYPDYQWIDILKEELSNKRPVYYSGRNSNDDGHAFICDGYDANGLFHFNWGEGGLNDGYYNINAALNWTYSQDMTTNIRPNYPKPRGTYRYDFSAHNIMLSWGSAESPIVESYTLEYKLATENTWRIIPDIKSSPYRLSGLKGNSTYSWRIKANYPFGLSSDYVIANDFTTEKELPSPTGVRIYNITSTSANLIWDWTIEAVGYMYLYFQQKDESSSSGGYTYIGTPQNIITLTSLRPNTIYEVWVVRGYPKYYDFTSPSKVIFTTLPATTRAALVKEDFQGVKIYSNPIEKTITVKSDIDIDELAVFDTSGKVVISDYKTEISKSIPINHLPKGVYIIKVKTKNGITTEKILN